MRPIFNEKIAEKWNLWICKQCMEPTCGWKLIEKSNFSAKKKNNDRNANASGKRKMRFPNIPLFLKEILEVPKKKRGYKLGQF